MQSSGNGCNEDSRTENETVNWCSHLRNNLAVLPDSLYVYHPAIPFLRLLGNEAWKEQLDNTE